MHYKPKYTDKNESWIKPQAVLNSKSIENKHVELKTQYANWVQGRRTFIKYFVNLTILKQLFEQIIFFLHKLANF